ncbi:MAG: nitroreductase [Synergistaceae bacterium]|jgi:nitroreductase|nr:nitroreductase [Synergistaceae bacterium]
MTNQVLSAISERRSIRDYKPDPVTDEQLGIILRAAQESPSARNEQPWHFTVVRNKETVREVNEESNKNLGDDHGDIFYDAPVVIFISAERGWKWSKLDSGIAVMNIALAAHSLGLGSVVLGLPDAAFNGPRENYFNKLLKFPENYEFAVAIAIGVPGATKEAHPIKPGKIAYVN